MLLVHEGEVDGSESWQPLGTHVVKAGTSRENVLQQVLDGQRPDGVKLSSDDPPQIPLEVGDYGDVFLIPESEIGVRHPVMARQVTVFDRVGS